MKIHTVEMRHVRRIAELKLDLSAPLTVIGGPNGIGKSTLQQAIMSALFHSSKEIRESFVSEFDPGNPPTVVLELSQGNHAARVCLTRSLLDDKGEWNDGTTLLKGKRQALDKVKELLPISAEAAALLLWGRHDDMADVLQTFPSDGHSLLTAAAIQGSGPDPKQIIKELEKEIENARKGDRGGKEVGALVQARNKQAQLEAELASAQSADAEHRSRREKLQAAKALREQIQQQSRELEEQITKLENLEKLLGTALGHLATCEQMQESQESWVRQDEDIEAARKHLAGLKNEYEQLRAQYRFARDEELAGKIEALEVRIQQVELLQTACADREKVFQARKRPTAADARAFQKLKERIKEANDKIEATGVRYELRADRGSRTVRIVEDGEPEREITLIAGQVHQGVVGRVTIEEDGLQFTAAGKQELSGLKQTVQAAFEEMRELFKRLEVADEADYLSLVAESDELRQSLEKDKTELKVQLRGATISALKSELNSLVEARAENKLTLADREAFAGKRLHPPTEIDRWCSQKNGEIQQAKESLAALEEKRPNDAERQLQTKALQAMRAKARDAVAAFSEGDQRHREPTKELAAEVRASLEKRRRERTQLVATEVNAVKNFADLSGQLKQTQPHRGLENIQSDLDEAREAHRREQVLQQARALLKERIEEKMQTLAAHVPIELGERVSRHLARLAGGWARHVALSKDLTVTHVSENGAAARTWLPQQLSQGERHQAALAVKIAVARALAEASGPVFVMLDDSLVNFDPSRRESTEEFLLEQASDGDLQIILLTCHTDWAADLKRRRPAQVNYIELVRCARYYHTPPAAAADIGQSTGGG